MTNSMVNVLSELFDEVISRATPIASNRALSEISKGRARSNRILAAGVLTISRIGIQAAAADRARAIEYVAELLKTRGLLGWMFTLLGLTNPWMILASWLIPVLIDWFLEREAAGVCGVGPELAQAADEFLK